MVRSFICWSRLKPEFHFSIAIFSRNSSAFRLLITNLAARTPNKCVSSPLRNLSRKVQHFFFFLHSHLKNAELCCASDELTLCEEKKKTQINKAYSIGLRNFLKPRQCVVKNHPKHYCVFETLAARTAAERSERL